MAEDREASLHARGLLLLRAVVGLVFVMHGGAKLFVYGLAGTVGAFEGMGVPLPQVSAPVVTAVELLGGLALILGAWTRWAGLLLAVDMGVAILLVRLPGGFFAPDGFELELTLLACVLALAALGPGPISVDAKRLKTSG
jgi:putative oxidoreductase